MSSMDQAAEADLLDQRLATQAEEEIVVPHPADALDDASEGDLLEQAQPAADDDDLYPYDTEE